MPLLEHRRHPCIDRGGISVPLHDGLLTVGEWRFFSVSRYRSAVPSHHVMVLCSQGDSGVKRRPSESPLDIRYLRRSPILSP